MTLAAIASSSPAAAGAAAIAICSADRALRARLERLVRADARLSVVGVVGDPAALTRLLAQTRLMLVLADRPAEEQLRRWTHRYRETAFIAMIDAAQPGALDLLRAGARAVLVRSSDDAAVAIAIAAVERGLCVLSPGLVQVPTSGAEAGEEPLRPADPGETPLTMREREVLAALADGLSNKAIARRLGISFHTAKFHVGGILAKLDADSRTEAVARAAQRGLVML
jgi:DNA-binding NarL/FixJ family response regulator